MRLSISILFFGMFIGHSTISFIILSMEKKACPIFVEDEIFDQSPSNVIISPEEIFEKKAYPITHFYVGPFPPSVKYVIKLLRYPLITNIDLYPSLIKLFGDHDVGKTTMIRTIAKEVGYTDYQEISNIPNTSLKSIINDFYKQKEFTGKPYIIVFTKPLHLEKDVLLNLRSYISTIQATQGPLVLFFEEKEKSDCDAYYDEVIPVEKPSAKHIKAIFNYIVNKKYKHNYHKLNKDTIEKLNMCTPPQIERIAERAIRYAHMNKSDITNDIIQKAHSFQAFKF